MTLSTSSSLLSKHGVSLSRSWNFSTRLSRIPSRPSSLSAIHRGLRDSEKARPQGFQKASLNASKPPRSTSWSRLRQDPDWAPPDFRLRKGKKDVTDEGPQALSRASRFNDPNFSRGKRSMVYRMKHGDLKEAAANLKKGPMSSEQFMKDFHSSPGQDTRGKRGRTDRDRFPDRAQRNVERGSRDWGEAKGGRDAPPSRFGDRAPRTTERGDRDWGEARGGRDAPPSRFGDRAPRTTERGDRDWGEARGGRDSPPSRFGDRAPRTMERGDQDWGEAKGGHESPATRFGGRNEERPGRGRRSTGYQKAPNPMRPREPRDHIGGWDQEPRQPPRNDDRGGYQEERRPRERRETQSKDFEDRKSPYRDDGAIRVHYTTAASQFLYGRSVVEAALKDSRRRMYRLYIYNGEDRRNLSQDAVLTNLAKRRDIPVVQVPRRDLKMLDKMSGDRPHNGCVLEASPLPQIPLKSLGPLSEDAAKPGFSLVLGRQSAEEVQVNGTSEFVSYHLPEGRKPFVLLLEGILDPGNLGAILRTAAFMGVNAVAITKRSSATLTAVALKASAGAAEAMTLFSVDSTLDFLARSKEVGWEVYAAVPLTSRSKGNTHLTMDRIETYDPLSKSPTILVVGNEGEGLTHPVVRQADFEVSIPNYSGMMSAVDSLNVSVATGVLCSAFLKKQSSTKLEIEESTDESQENDDNQLW